MIGFNPQIAFKLSCPSTFAFCFVNRQASNLKPPTNLNVDAACLIGCICLVRVWLVGLHPKQTYKINNYGDSVKKSGLNYVQYAIVEMAAPEDMDATQALVRTDRMADTEKILFVTNRTADTENILYIS
jgi:hypothetical protein